MRPIVWMSEPLSGTLCNTLRMDTTLVKSVDDFIDQPRDPRTLSFVDSSTLAILDQLAYSLSSAVGASRLEWGKLIAAVSVGPVILVCSDPIQSALGLLQPRPWLSHVVSAAMLEHPMAVDHLRNVMATLTKVDQPKLADWLRSGAAVGRRVRLTHASSRTQRLQKMSEFFHSNGVDTRSVTVLRDATEELLTNAFYDAPLAAGVQMEPIPRTQDVSLPKDAACDLVYGTCDDLAIVRLRDPFGSLSRERLIEVLNRYSRTGAPIDEDVTMGGSGLGLWRVFSTVSLVAFSVVGNQHTEALIGIGTRHSDSPPPYAFHFFFKGGAKRKLWVFADEDAGASTSTVSVVVASE